MTTHTRSLKYSSRYPLLREARRIFQTSGKTGLERWVSRLSYDEKYRLASQIITTLSQQTGRDPADVALEIFKGKWEVL